jgi:hypothetical protein
VKYRLRLLRWCDIIENLTGGAALERSEEIVIGLAADRDKLIVSPELPYGIHADPRRRRTCLLEHPLSCDQARRPKGKRVFALVQDHTAKHPLALPQMDRQGK